MPILPMFPRGCPRLSATSGKCGNSPLEILVAVLPVTRVSATNVSRGPPRADKSARPEGPLRGAHRRAVFVRCRHAVLEPQAAAAVDPQAVGAQLHEVRALPVGAEPGAAVLAGDLEAFEAVGVFDGTLRAHDGGARLLLLAVETGEAGGLGAGVAAAGAADQHQLADDIGIDQALLIEHRIGGAADQGAEVLEIDAGAALVETRRGFVVVLEAAVGQQRAAVQGDQAVLAVEQEVAAVEGGIVAAVDHLDAVLAVLSED